MPLGDYLKVFHDLPVFEFPAPGAPAELPDPASVAWRLSAPTYAEPDEDEPWQTLFTRFLATVDTARVRAVVVGGWEEAYDEDCSSAAVVKALVAAKDRLSGLEAVFLGDMLSEDCEISWIAQSDVTPLLAAYPGLRTLGVRGSTGLAFPPVRHEALRTLVVQTGGLPAALVRDIAACELPALEHLELWLGTEWYGGDSTPADLEPILEGTRLPALRHLGLCNGQRQDDVAAAAAHAPVVARLAELDLSMGVLTDAGARALLAGQPLGHLKRLDLSYHYLSEEMCERIVAALAPHGVAVDVSDRQVPDVYDGGIERYTAVGE